ncbi:MAG: hypothetical protein R6X18_05010 [Chloroflexota bacterium]
MTGNIISHHALNCQAEDFGKQFKQDFDPPDVSYRLLEEEQPQYRLEHLGEGALCLTELMAVVSGSDHSDNGILKLTRLLGELGGLPGRAGAVFGGCANYQIKVGESLKRYG